MERITLPSLAKRLATEADAYLFMESLRWGAENENLRCPHCGGEKAYFLKPADGTARKTRTGSASQRRVWKCATCRKQFSVLTGTCFHGTKVPLQTWLMVIFEMCASKNGVSCREIERKYSLSPKTAWFVLHRIREAMKDDGLTMFRGIVIADETLIGGKYRNMHKSKRPKDQRAGTEGATAHKIPVLTLIDQDTGQARSRVLPRVTAATLRKAIAEQTDMPNTTLYTDGHSAYFEVGREVAQHETVDHNKDEYVRYAGGKVITSNACESFFSQLRRSIDGTHHHVSREHLHRYLAEFDFRHTTRKMTDSARMMMLMGQLEGRRVAYRGIIGG